VHQPAAGSDDEAAGCVRSVHCIALFFTDIDQMLAADRHRK